MSDEFNDGYETEFDADFRAESDRDAGAERLATGLGWFSIALGIAEAIAPRQVAELAGLSSGGRAEGTIRAMGVREIAAGVAVLLHPERSGPVWSRVAGDAVDLSLLSAAYAKSSVDPARFIAATAAIASVTALDIYCAARLAQTNRESEFDAEGLTEPETLPM